MSQDPAQSVSAAFAARYGPAPAVVARAPGRVNLIGEHTDYNDGFVLPMAIEQSTWVGAGMRDDGMVHAYSAVIDDQQQWPVAGWRRDTHADWTSYVAGVAALMHQQGGPKSGLNLTIASDVPVGGGLSSSAALEVATATALATLYGLQISPVELADIARAAEHQYAGVPCGIMDQYASALAQAGRALLLDCRTRAIEHIPMPLGEYMVLIVNSGVRHKLASGEYGRRQEQCQAAVAFFRGIDAGVQALRDVRAEQVAEHERRMDPIVAARARHVVTENARTQAAADALRRGDLAEVGRLMCASHASLRDDYEVSCEELDRLVDIVTAAPGVLGARMTGGGFGGCIVALVAASEQAAVQDRVHREYDGAGFGPAQFVSTRPGAGAGVLQH